jgi:3-dehydroquinate dehydratase II
MTGVLFVLNGPNLNLLGSREPEIYGADTLDTIAERLIERARPLGLSIDMRESNHEGHLVDWLQQASAEAAAVILNAGGYSHTSVAVRDAVAACAVPVVEVHLSNIHAREPFRATSLVSAVAAGSIVGLGAFGYELALDAAARLCKGAARPAAPAARSR